MSVLPKCFHSNGNANVASTEQFDSKSDENVFCTKDNLEGCLHELSEEFLSFGIAPVIAPNHDDDMQSAESLKRLTVKIINSTWNLIHKHRSFMRLHDKTVLSNNRTCNDNVHLKNQVARLKEDLQKKEQALCETQAKESRLKDNLESVSRDLKHEKEETRKLRKQAQSKDVQHEHEVKRILTFNQKLQERLQKSAGTFVPQGKVLGKVEKDREKELASYKNTICRLEENSRQMLEEIHVLKETLMLHEDAIALQMAASGAWTDVEE
ncbi:PREDICTED: afadin- and alpha-actinin-binding protein A-like [Dinoponera quadriceps]|uniref:Afadin- and alpha-actinin-binding protein A-like n=1 Tax=Dinoponera quadriceps TaxID=609295 RepID=A0A6P3XKK3_DINQU|nr:PREDICTED: afadin- and alpha-actinin-binding protein A-like [Dinoponera quadriceps]